MHLYEFVQIFYEGCKKPMNQPDFLVLLIDQLLKDGIQNPLSNLSLDSQSKIFKGTQRISKKHALAIANNADLDKFAIYANDVEFDTQILIENKLKDAGVDGIDPDNLEDKFGLTCGELFLVILRKEAEQKRANKTNKRIFSWDDLKNYTVYRSRQLSEDEMKSIFTDASSVIHLQDNNEKMTLKEGQIYQITTVFHLELHLEENKYYIKASFQNAGDSYSCLLPCDEWISNAQIESSLGKGDAQRTAWLKLNLQNEKVRVDILALGPPVHPIPLCEKMT